MKLRPPAIPLITIDPYFSVWSATDNLYDSAPVHWTGSPDTMYGYVIIDGEQYRFLGKDDTNHISQIAFDMGALYTEYVFSTDSVRLTLNFYSSLFPDDLFRLSRPVSYIRFDYESLDQCKHDVKIKISVSEEICLNLKNEKAVSVKEFPDNDFPLISIGSKDQEILSRSGDDIRIDWGYFYMSSPEGGRVYSDRREDMTFVNSEFSLAENNSETVLFAYDDIKCLNYFGTETDAYWKTINPDIIDVINEAYSEEYNIFNKCVKDSETLYKQGNQAGGTEYADLLTLSFRQIIAAHKLAVDDKNNIIFISKECFSNGCAATVDVTYPSSPFFILYNTELLKGMLRPIFKFSRSDEWTFDFAPHDAGCYPLLSGQVYGKNIEDGTYLSYQMPVEECGNMLIMMANISLREGNTEFFDENKDILDNWVRYLITYGMDPDNQLCTDDFAGHLAHNCNLSLKAIMGIAGYALIYKIKNEPDKSDYYMKTAAEMAENWVKTAANEDGSFRLAFDRPDTFSMKYNMIWDKLWHTELFAPSVRYSEFCSDKKHINAYGMPLDNRKTYTKSDWLLWTACLAPTKEEFIDFIHPMWKSYSLSPSRVPMTDWYDTVTSEMVGFRHRSVQGGLYIKLLENLLR